METTISRRRLHLLIYLSAAAALLSRLVSLLRFRPNLVSLRELHLHVTFLRHGLLPTTVDLDATTSLHLWIPSHRRHGIPPLVLIHGFGGNSKWQWHRQIGPLSSSFDLYIPDLVFFGRSRSDGADRSVAFQARCVADAMRNLGVRRYSVCGISYGGFVGFRMAAEEREEVVERVVVMTAGICATAEERREMVEREERDVCDVLLPRTAEDLTALMRRSMHRPPRWVPAFLLRDFVELMYKVHRKERVEMLKELLSVGAGMNPLPILTQETLIIWGDRDEVFPLCLAHQLKSHLGEKSRLEIVGDAGHACQIEKPHLVNHLIQSFLLDPKT